MERIRLADRAAFQDVKMARHRLAATSRLHTDLYCLRPGQVQAPHVHAEQDKLYVGIEGRARIRVGPDVEWLEPGILVVAPAGAEHGWRTPRPTRASSWSWWCRRHRTREGAVARRERRLLQVIAQARPDKIRDL